VAVGKNIKNVVGQICKTSLYDASVMGITEAESIGIS
jgi:hypothetical protein